MRNAGREQGCKCSVMWLFLVGFGREQKVQTLVRHVTTLYSPIIILGHILRKEHASLISISYLVLGFKKRPLLLLYPFFD